MKFLDLNGLKHLLTKIKTDFSTSITPNSKYIEERDGSGRIRIPFVAKHQIVTMITASDINVCDWYKDAPEGGILEIVFAGAKSGHTYCVYRGTSLIFKMVAEPNGAILKRLDYLSTNYSTYARFIKSDKRLVVAEFVTNN